MMKSSGDSSFTKEENKNFWFVAVPESAVGAKGFNTLRAKVEPAADFVSQFPLPRLRVGSLDSLLALSEDLGRKDQYFEAIVNRIARQLHDLYINPETNQMEKHERLLTVNNMGLETYLANFQWDEAKYKLTSPLKDVVEAVSATMSKLDEELRIKSSAFQAVNQAISAEKKKSSGNLVVRDLTDVVKEKHCIESEYFTTLFVVINKSASKEWLETYETFVTDIVPRSSELIHSEGDFNLYNVVLFRKMADDFKTKARTNKWTVREFKYDPKAVQSSLEDLKKYENKRTKQKNSLVKWCRANLAEGITSWVHLKTARTFVEAVLRYGLPTDYMSVVIEPSKNSEGKLRKILSSLYASLGSSYIDGDDSVDQASLMAGVTEKFYPYVWSKMTVTTTNVQ